MAFDLTAAASVLKEDYKGPIREQLNMGTPLLAEIQKQSDMTQGKRIYIPLHIYRSEGIGARADGGSLPTAYAQGYKEAVENVAYQYGRIEVTLPTIESTKTDSGAFLRAVDAETKGITSELKEDHDRQIARNGLFGNPNEGVLVRTTDGASSATTWTIDTPDVTSIRTLRVGMVVDVTDNAGAALTNGAGRVISAVTSAGVVTMGTANGHTDPGGALDTVALGRVYRTGNKSNEVIGLPGIIDDSSTLHGLAPATYTFWKSTNLNNSGTPRALSEDLMQQTLDSIAADSGEEPDAIVCEYTQRRKFYALLSSMKRAVNTVELKGGFTALTFNDTLPLIIDRFCPTSVMYFINRKHLFLEQMADWDWADQDGSVLSRVSGKPNFEAFLFKFCNLVTDRRNAFGKLADLA